LGDSSAILQWAQEHLLTAQVGWSIVILLVSALLQATAGFGAALLGLPLLLIAGNRLFEAQLLLLCAMLPQNVFACWRLRKSIDYREVATPALIRTLAMPIGVLGLSALMLQSEQTIGQVVGSIILLSILLQAMTGVEFKSARRWPWMLLTFGGSGILQGLSGIGGPPMVLWVYGQRYSVDRARAFLFAVYVANFIPQMIVLRWKFGSEIWAATMIGFLVTPFILLAAEGGLRLGSRLGDRWMRPAVYVTLAVLALIMILRPLL
jgi:uncharacterized protein